MLEWTNSALIPPILISCGATVNTQPVVQPVQQPVQSGPAPVVNARSFQNPINFRLDIHYKGGISAAGFSTTFGIYYDFVNKDTLKYSYPTGLNLYCSGANWIEKSYFSAFTQTGDLILWNNYVGGVIGNFGRSITCTLSWTDDLGHNQSLTASAQVPRLNIKTDSGYTCDQEISKINPMMQGSVRWPGGAKPSCSIGGYCGGTYATANEWGICIGD